MYFHSGRPYLEKMDLADMELHEYTSAEYGMPSGHSMASISNPLIMYYFFTKFEYKTYWDKNTIKKNLILLSIIIYALAVAYSRIYTGRHTAD